MTDDFRMYPTSQHTRLTMKEMLSSEQDGDYYKTANGILFNNVEVMGTVKDGKAGDDYTKFTLVSGNGMEISVVESGMFRNEEMSSFMAKLPDESVVLVLGKYSEYQTAEGEQGRNIRPKIVKVFSNDKDLELWKFNLLESRMLNGYPVLIDDDLQEIADDIGLQKLDADGTAMMVRYNYTIERKEPEVIRERAVTTKREITVPSPKPKIPEEIGKKVEETKDIEGEIIKMLMNESGMNRDEVNNRVDDMKEEFDMLSRRELLIAMAKDFKMDVSAYEIKKARPPVKAAPAKQVDKPERKVTTRKDTDDPAEAILAYLDNHGGSIDLVTLRSSMKKDGFTAKQTESSIMSLFGKGRVDGDDKELRRV